ncbi:MAG: NADH-quinone oxidoreductase subunit NuoG [Acidimicrobiia bacterium]|nr:NADH-quinone oxidoreductase subunit NuoG [Acidimicrobiia bacterium]
MTDATGSPATVKVTIDGKEIEAAPGELIIKVAQEHGVYIPRFCWHERMKPVGMCRMCLVEVEGVRGLPPSCTTPVTDGMVVHTQSPAVKKAQEGVLEFLLVNHPLDCPVCDRGGECPLQDQTLAFGPGESRFVEEKRHFEKPIPISDLVLLDRERCIQCARCTRFADEVAGDPLITFVERGDETQVLTFPDEPFASYFSGNTVQICPVGALTAKPYRFKARPWDLTTVESSCTACAVGCRVALQSTSNQLVRMLGVDSEPVNHGWLCDKGRYGFQYVHSPERIRAPRVRRDGALVEATWPEALDVAASGLRRVLDLHGPAAVAVLGGARGTNEDAYVWARLAKGVIGTDHVDAQLGDGLPADVVLGLPRAEIADCDRAAGIVLAAPDLKEELPVLYLRIRRAATELGVPLVDLAPRDHGLTRHAAAVVRHAPGEAALAAQKLVRALSGSRTNDQEVDRAAEALAGRDGDVIVVLGRPSLAESADVTVDTAAALAAIPGVRFLSALRRSNVHGALDLGLAPGFLPGRVTLEAGRDWFTDAWGSVPGDRGLDAGGILEAASQGRVHALVLVGADPLADFPDRALARMAVDSVGFIVAVDAFVTESTRHADVFLPVTLYGERAGTVTNLEGRVQRVGQKISPDGTPMDDWRIAAELALRLGHDLDLVSVEEVQDEIARVAPAHRGSTALVLRHAHDGVVVPLGEHLAELDLGHPGHRVAPAADAEPGATGVSWEPIPSGRHVEETTDEALAEARAGVEAAATELAPGLHAWDRTAAGATVPARDAYALRLVAGRTLYDKGRAVAESPSIAGLARGATLLVNRADRERIGVADGDEVKVTSSRGSVTLAVRADPATPPGVAFLAFATAAPGAADLIDVSRPVTDLRVETLR